LESRAGVIAGCLWWTLVFGGWAPQSLGAEPLRGGESRMQQAGSEPAVPSGVAGWDEFIDSLRSLPERMLARLPESMREDPQLRQEVARLALESLASNTLAAIGADGDHPVFLPSIGQVLNVGQPNADTVYRSARITPGGSYRIRGQRGTLRIANIGEVGQGIRNYHDFNSLRVDAEGRFDVLLSPSRPAGYTGDWWPLSPATGQLLMRLVSADWGQERAPTFSIERIDKPVARPRATAAELEQRLRALPAGVDFLALMFVDHVEQLRQQGYVNKFKVLDVSQAGGLVGQYYYEGAYELADDEALVVETKVPMRCGYRSLILTNEIYETIDWYNNHSSLNDAQAPADADGVLRIVVSAKDPGVPNWLDTAGHSRGLIQGRWTDCDSQPIPGVRKLRLGELRQSLAPATPTVTPAQREQIVRERRAALQQRALW